MPQIIEGHLEGGDARFGIVVSRFNGAVTGRLLEGALATLRRHGVNTEERVTVARCPGAFEAPLVARRMAMSGEYDAVICLGAVIRGETPHFDFICAEAARGVAQSALETGLPVIFGILTTDSVEQAMERAGETADVAEHTDPAASASNKGSESALAALEMVTLMDQL